MNRISWKSDYSIGLRAIDNQHRKIFEYLLALENALEKKEPWHSIRYLLAQLAEYLDLHFATEEALLEIISFPNLAEHRAAHANLGKAVKELEDHLRERYSIDEVVEFFEAWFITHVLAMDTRYVEHARREFPVKFPT